MSVDHPHRYAVWLLAVAVLSVSAGSLDAKDQSGPTEVDLQLVIASDVSTSMSIGEKQLQLQGFVAAFRDRDVIRSVMRGQHGRIAITYIEWGGEGRQRIVLPWHLVDGPDSARAFADRLDATRPGRLLYGTSMGDALVFGASLFEDSGFASERRVIDISGDGKSNKGAPLEIARAHVVARNITINGLPIIYEKRELATLDIFEFSADDLTHYFETQVIGGPDAFVEPVWKPTMYSQAIRQKLIREISGRERWEARFSGLP